MSSSHQTHMQDVAGGLGVPVPGLGPSLTSLQMRALSPWPLYTVELGKVSAHPQVQALFLSALCAGRVVKGLLIGSWTRHLVPQTGKVDFLHGLLEGKVTA